MTDKVGHYDKKRKIGELLIVHNLITPTRLQKALAEAKQAGKRLGDILVASGEISDTQLVENLAELYNVTAINLAEMDLDPEVVNLVKQHVAEKYTLIAINRAASDLIVAFSDPSDIHAVDAVKFQTGYNVVIVIATEKSIKAAIEKYYKGNKDSVAEALQRLTDEELVPIAMTEEKVDAAELLLSSEQAPIVKLVNAMLADAIQKGASDIHIEPYEKEFRVRYRIDGRLYKIVEPPLNYRQAIISRLKIMANLDIAERRTPQDGRFKVRFGNNQDMDFRVSTFPAIRGEKIVLRLLDKKNLQKDMVSLGFEENQLADFKRAISRPYGMVLVTGPTGSGKTTTLYSALNALNQIDNNICTVEDPVEFEIPGINQGPVNEDVGLNFAAALRSFLRQDPDIIMVGEIRDFETAEIAVKAALTGHLVLSTLHTNDAPSTINRLLNMGIEPFLVANSLDTVVAQRLIRKLCVACKKATDVTEQALREAQIPPVEIAEFNFMSSIGCNQCNQTGYKGRIALYEVMVIGPELQELIQQGANTSELKREAIRLGMMTMRQSGINRIKEGITSIGEVIASTIAD